MSKSLVFVVEDDLHIAQLIKYNLETNGYEVCLFEDGKKAYEAFLEKLPKVAILDIMIPEMDGLELLRQVRKMENGNDVSIIMLTAKNDEFDRVLGLELGADDYISKPFSIRELNARIKAVLRRSYKTEPKKEEEKTRVICGDLIIDPSCHKVFKGNKQLVLTLKEFELLKYLMINKGKVLTRDLLLDEIWGYDATALTRTVDVHIRRLRFAIGDEYIETVRGIGYRFTEDILQSR